VVVGASAGQEVTESGDEGKAVEIAWKMEEGVVESGTLVLTAKEPENRVGEKKVVETVVDLWGMVVQVHCSHSKLVVLDTYSLPGQE